MRGESINRLCRSLESPEERSRFYANEDAYCLRFGLRKDEREAIKDRDYLTLIDLGGHVAHLDKLAALTGLNTVEAIRLRTGVSIDALIGKLLQTDH
jgi:protocatechuate 4,5-dioxygenase, alpha chain